VLTSKNSETRFLERLNGLEFILGRAVIHDDDFEVLFGRPKDALHSLCEEVETLIVGDDNAYTR
jgi:hypothetical protein